MLTHGGVGRAAPELCPWANTGLVAVWTGRQVSGPSPAIALQEYRISCRQVSGAKRAIPASFKKTKAESASSGGWLDGYSASRSTNPVNSVNAGFSGLPRHFRGLVLAHGFNLCRLILDD